MLMVKTIFSNLLKKYSTRLYPGEERILPDGFRGRFKFKIEKCILCRQCVVKCPTKVIRIDPEVGLWEREVMGCLYCGVCADVCPTGCIAMTNTYRPPITEQSFLRFNVKPRPSKKKTTSMDEGEIQKALQDKIVEDAAGTANGGGKREAVEEDVVIAAPKVEAAQASHTPRANEAPAKPQMPPSSGKAPQPQIPPAKVVRKKR